MTQLILKGFFLFCDPVLKVAFFPSERVFFSTPIYFSKGSNTYSLEFFSLLGSQKRNPDLGDFFFQQKYSRSSYNCREPEKMVFLKPYFRCPNRFFLERPKKMPNTISRKILDSPTPPYNALDILCQSRHGEKCAYLCFVWYDFRYPNSS